MFVLIDLINMDANGIRNYFVELEQKIRHSEVLVGLLKCSSRFQLFLVYMTEVAFVTAMFLFLPYH